MRGAPRTCMAAIACAASASVVNRAVTNRCGNILWSMMPIDQPSSSTQIARVGTPLTFIPQQITALLQEKRCFPAFARRCYRAQRGGSIAVDYEAEYNNRARVPEYQEIFARWAR